MSNKTNASILIDNHENDFNSFINISSDLLDKKYGILNINGGYQLKRDNESDLLLYVRNTMNILLEKVDKVVVYAYLEGYKTKNMRIKFIQNISNILQTEYPDILYKCYIINAPSYFSVVYKFVSFMLDKETKSKIIFKNCKFNELEIKNLEVENVIQ